MLQQVAATAKKLRRREERHKRAMVLHEQKARAVYQQWHDLVLTFVQEYGHTLAGIRGSVPQRVIALAAGVQQSYISDVERGEQPKRLGVDALYRIVQAYADLLQEDGSGPG